MKRFRFPLEKVLKLRSQETEQSKRALGFAIAREEEARAAQSRALAELECRTEEARTREAAGIAVHEFGVVRSYLAFLQRQLQEADAALYQARQQVQRRREELIGARKREKALERLKEHRREQYLVESLREEQKELDEYGNRQGLNRIASGTDI